MSDISNEKAIQVMKTLKRGYLDLTDNRRIYKDCCIVLDSIDASIRALSNERTDGSWLPKRKHEEMKFYCSECGEAAPKLEGGLIKLSRFCSDCGSKMKLHNSEVRDEDS